MVEAGKAKNLKVQVRIVLRKEVCAPWVLEWMVWIVGHNMLQSLLFHSRLIAESIEKLSSAFMAPIASKLLCLIRIPGLPGNEAGVLAYPGTSTCCMPIHAAYTQPFRKDTTLI